MLQTRSGQADRGRGREDRRRHGRRGHRSPRKRRSPRIEPAHVDQLLRDQFDPAAAPGATRIAKGLNASPGAAVGKAVFDADPAVEWVGRGRAGHPRPHRDLARRLPRHGRGAGHPHRPRRRDLARRGRRPPDRQAVRGRLRRARHRLRGRHGPQHESGVDVHGGRLDQRRRHDRRGLPRRAARPCRRASRTSPSSSTILGWADEHPPDGGLDQRRQARGGRPGARRYGAAGHRPVPDRAHVPRGRAARDRARRDPRRQRRDPGEGQRRDAGETLDADEPRRSPVRRRDGQARGPPAGRLRGHLQGDGRAAGRHPPDRPAAARVPAQPRGAAGRGHPGRARHGRARPESRTRSCCATIESLREQNPMLGPARLPAGADDPRLREDPDPGHPQRRRSPSSRPAATRSPRS